MFLSANAAFPKRILSTLQLRHNGRYGVSNHQLRHCLLNRLFRRRSKKISKLRVTVLCVGNSPGPVNSPHKGPVTRKMFSFDDVIMDLKRQPTCRISSRHFCCTSGWTIIYNIHHRIVLAVDSVPAINNSMTTVRMPRSCKRTASSSARCSCSM